MTDLATYTEGVTAETDAEVFKRYFPQGQIEPTSLADLPGIAVEKFEGYSKRFIKTDEYTPGNFDAVFRISHIDGSLTYVSKQIKTYKERGKVENEESTYLCDMDSSGNLVGWGEISKDLNSNEDFFKNKPLVGYTFTETDHRGTGLGYRRLHIMNALTQMLYHEPLNSGSSPDPSAARIWERLVTEGKARIYTEGEKPRYAFLP